MKVTTECIAAQSISSYYLRSDAYNQFLSKMDAAMKLVEKLGSPLAKYVSCAFLILCGHFVFNYLPGTLCMSGCDFYQGIERDWR